MRPQPESQSYLELNLNSYACSGGGGSGGGGFSQWLVCQQWQWRMKRLQAQLGTAFAQPQRRSHEQPLHWGHATARRPRQQTDVSVTVTRRHNHPACAAGLPSRSVLNSS